MIIPLGQEYEEVEGVRTEEGAGQVAKDLQHKYLQRTKQPLCMLVMVTDSSI